MTCCQHVFVLCTDNPTEKQWMRLMDVVAADRGMQGDFQGRGAAGRVAAKWETLAATLNAMGGAFKTGEKWKEAFNNLRNRAKRQYSDRVRYMGATGGGRPPQQLGLNAECQRVMQFVPREQLHGNAVPVPLQVRIQSLQAQLAQQQQQPQQLAQQQIAQQCAQQQLLMQQP
ncbi:Ribosome-recycling factor [Frankliniella fusca]|uniref:Regulatory protein zeste n=1 Tax=Frankliniella fusca TaxID=407009 RepID=A0AAE1I018_9NEOP|nr:Ribosome-recycling factor [Frankliniella fusca]